MTTTINTIDKQTARRLGGRIEELLKPLEAEYGLTVAYKGGSFDSESFRPKIEIAVRSENGALTGRDATAFRNYATFDGFEDDDLGKSFKAQGHEYTIIGYSPRSPKRPVLARRSDDGKTYKWPSAAVLRFIGKTSPTPRIGTVEVNGR